MAAQWTSMATQLPSKTWNVGVHACPSTEFCSRLNPQASLPANADALQSGTSHLAGFGAEIMLRLPRHFSLSRARALRFTPNSLPVKGF